MFIPEDYAQINLKFTGDAAPTGAEVTFGADVSGTAGDPSSIAAAVSVAYQDAGLDGISVGALTLSTILVKFGPNDEGPFANFPVGIDGTAANPSTLVNGALLIHKVTDLGGRHGRGRMFWPGIPDNQVDADGTVHSGYLTSVGEWLEDFRGKLIADLIIPVLLHADPEYPHPPFEVVALQPQPKMATQRRRLRR